MLEVREEDEREQVPIPLKNVSPAVPKDDSELKKLVEDLRRMGCDGLLGKSWNLKSEATLREFKYERGNQWIQAFRQDPEKWTAEVWAKVYDLHFGRVRDGRTGRILFTWASIEGIMIQRTDSTPEIAGIRESGG
jgi:hypothetical protein